MKGESIARVRRQQELAAKNRLADIAAREEGRMAMLRLQRAYSIRNEDYAGTYGGYVEPKQPKKANWRWWT